MSPPQHFPCQAFSSRGVPLQADASGGLDPVTERKLRDIAKALEHDGDYEPKIRRDLSPGIVLTREWKGDIHKVTVAADGFQYLGRRYGSLSDIARMITGTLLVGSTIFSVWSRRNSASRESNSSNQRHLPVIGEAL